MITREYSAVGESIIHCVFENHQAQLTTTLRCKRFMTNERFDEWALLLGPDVVSSTHPQVTADIAREFIKFYEIALKSANEAKYWLCLLRDSYIELKPLCEELLSELNEVSNMLGSSILTLKGKRKF